MARKTIEVYTDGACRGNPGPGGWGVLLRYSGVEKELWGGEPETTNNRMELTAAIRALEALNQECEVDLYTDSTYVRDGITRWMENWKRRGWKTANRKPVKSVDEFRTALEEKPLSEGVLLLVRSERGARLVVLSVAE